MVMAPMVIDYLRDKSETPGVQNMVSSSFS